MCTQSGKIEKKKKKEEEEERKENHAKNHGLNLWRINATSARWTRLNSF